MENYILLMAVIGGVIFLLYHFLMYLRTGVPIVISPKAYIDFVIKYLKDDNLINSQSVVYELGSGWGGFSLAVAKLGPKKILAYELSPVHILYSKIKAKILSSPVEFRRDDFFKADLSQADIIYTFLMPKVVERLWQKMKAECRPGTLMILLGHDIFGVEPVVRLKVDGVSKNKGIYYLYKI